MMAGPADFGQAYHETQGLQGSSGWITLNHYIIGIINQSCGLSMETRPQNNISTLNTKKNELRMLKVQHFSQTLTSWPSITFSIRLLTNKVKARMEALKNLHCLKMRIIKYKNLILKHSVNVWQYQRTHLMVWLQMGAIFCLAYLTILTVLICLF